MSPIGRIFIVLNLILAALFLGWASHALGTTENYRTLLAEEETAHKATEVAAAEEKDQLDTTINALEDQTRATREERNLLQADKERLETQLSEEKRSNEQMHGDLTSIRATLNDYNDTIRQLEASKDGAVERAHEAEGERDDATAAAQAAEQLQRDAEDAKRGSDLRVTDLEGQRTGLQDQVTQLETHLAMVFEMTGLSVQSLVSVPKIDGQVLDVRMDLAPGLVMLNVGKNQKVERGYTFEVWHGSQYKGQVRVADVQGDVCSALVVNAVEGTMIRQGDSASTIL
jgi:hypothetical protein